MPYVNRVIHDLNTTFHPDKTVRGRSWKQTAEILDGCESVVDAFEQLGIFDGVHGTMQKTYFNYLPPSLKMALKAALLDAARRKVATTFAFVTGPYISMRIEQLPPDPESDSPAALTVILEGFCAWIFARQVSLVSRDDD